MVTGLLYLTVDSVSLSHLVQRCEAIDIGGVYVRPPGDEAPHLVPVTRSAGRQEHAAVTEPDPALLPLEVPRLARRLTVLPPLELLRSLHEGGVRPGLERHDQRNITITWTQHCTAHYWVLTGQSRPVPQMTGCWLVLGAQAWPVNGSKREG